MAIDVKAAERSLSQMTVPQLQGRYVELFGDETRTHHKTLLIKRILWQMQALREGDLSERARQRARELANDADLRRGPPKPNGAASPPGCTIIHARKPNGLDLAAKVLAGAKEPLAAKTIAEKTIAAGWKTSGKTPHATLYAAIIREIATKGKDARFKKTDRGLFTANGGAKRGTP